MKLKRKQKSRKTSNGVSQRWIRRRPGTSRSGQASMDYFLGICILLPIVWFLMTVVPRMIQLVYELAIVVIGTPFM